MIERKKKFDVELRIDGKVVAYLKVTAEDEIDAMNRAKSHTHIRIKEQLPDIPTIEIN